MNDERAWIGALLSAVTSAVGPWVRGRIGGWPASDNWREPAPADPAYVLRVMRDQWSRLAPPLAGPQLTDVRQLHELRNRWAHNDELGRDEVLLAKLHAERLCRAIGVDLALPPPPARRQQEPPATAAVEPKPSSRNTSLATATGQRGRRLPEDTPDPPDPASLSHVQVAAQDLLRTLVERAAGRFGSTTRIPVGDLDPLVALCNEWAHKYGEPRSEGWYFGGTPGLWHAFDNLYPLEDPNRWDRLRKAVTEELERRNWRRISLPRGAAFWVDQEATTGG